MGRVKQQSFIFFFLFSLGCSTELYYPVSGQWDEMELRKQVQGNISEDLFKEGPGMTLEDILVEEEKLSSQLYVQNGGSNSGYDEVTQAIKENEKLFPKKAEQVKEEVKEKPLVVDEELQELIAEVERDEKESIKATTKGPVKKEKVSKKKDKLPSHVREDLAILEKELEKEADQLVTKEEETVKQEEQVVEYGPVISLMERSEKKDPEGRTLASVTQQEELPLAEGKMKKKVFFSGKIPLNAAYIVRQGDSLSAISEKIYGNQSEIEALRSFNPHLKKVLEVGDIIYYNSPERPLDKDRIVFYYEGKKLFPQVYRLKPGESLKKVAKKLLGHEESWKELWATHPNLTTRDIANKTSYLRYWHTEPHIVRKTIQPPLSVVAEKSTETNSEEDMTQIPLKEPVQIESLEVATKVDKSDIKGSDIQAKSPTIEEESVKVSQTSEESEREVSSDLAEALLAEEKQWEKVEEASQEKVETPQQTEESVRKEGGIAPKKLVYVGLGALFFVSFLIFLISKAVRRKQKEGVFEKNTVVTQLTRVDSEDGQAEPSQKTG